MSAKTPVAITSSTSQQRRLSAKGEPKFLVLLTNKNGATFRRFRELQRLKVHGSDSQRLNLDAAPGISCYVLELWMRQDNERTAEVRR